MSSGGIGAFDRFCFTQVTVNPGSISASSSQEVIFTLPGLLTTDVVLNVIKPTLSAGVDIGNFRSSAANTLRVTFQNSSASPVVLTSEVYTVVVARPEKALGGPDALSGGAVIFN